MNKEEQLEDMMKVTEPHRNAICKAGCDDTAFSGAMVALIKAGYHKEDDTVKGLFTKIKNDIMLYTKLSGFNDAALNKILDLFVYEQKALFAEYGIAGDSDE